MSSRNIYLNPEERRAARVLHQSLEAARLAIQGGERHSATLHRMVLHRLKSQPLAEVEYVGLVDALTFEPIDLLRGHCIVALAVRFGKTRLLDNLHLDLGDINTDTDTAPETSSDDLWIG